MKRLFFIIVWVSCVLSLHAQLTVNGSQTNAQLAQLISGPGISISNITVDCQTTSSGKGYGRYNAASTNLNISEGLLLTTGNIENAIGPNNVGNKGSWFDNNGTSANNSTNPTKALIQAQSGKTIYEFCEFSFDVIPNGDTLKFDYVFASEEYNEYVNSNYNDAFGFYISGVNPAGGLFVDKNIAIIPGTSQAVTINNVNNGVASTGVVPTGPCKNCQYYQSNDNGTTVQYDGFTKNLKAVSGVVPCQTYRLKLVVADANDRKYDSGVFIEKISSTPSLSISSSTMGGTPFTVEGCNPATVSFTRATVTPLPMQVQYFISGTATNGVDYPLIGSASPTAVKYITIPANRASASLTLAPYADGIDEPEETVIFSLDNPGCPAGLNISHTVTIRDSIFPSLTPPNTAICAGGSVTLNGSAPAGVVFSWSPATALSNSAVGAPVASPLTSTLYTMTAKLANCSETRKSKVDVNPLPDTKTPTGPGQICLGSSANIVLPASQNGISYQLASVTPSAANIGTAQTGNGNGLTFNTGSVTANTGFVIRAVNPATSCALQMPTSLTVAVPATPGAVAGNMDTDGCWVYGGNAWVHFVQAGTNHIIASVNPNGNNLGWVDAKSFVDGAPIDIQACGTTQDWFETTVMSRRWTIKPTIQPTGNPVDVRLYFQQSEFNSLKTAANSNGNLMDDVGDVSGLVLSKYSGANEDGSFANNCGNGTTRLFNQSGNGNITSMFSGFNSTGRYVQYSIPGFSEFWLHGNSNGGVSPLPVVLTSFGAECHGAEVAVKWTTATEINNAYFTVSRSADAVNWEPFAVTQGAGGSNQVLSYTAVDQRPLPGTSYYRLHQTDFDGTSEYFSPVSVACGNQAGQNTVSVYPNPAESEFNLSIHTDTKDSKAYIEIIDITGKTVSARTVAVSPGETNVQFERNGLAAGTYFVRVRTAGTEFGTQKVILR